MNILYYIAIILLSGMIFAKIATLIKLPHVTGYLVSGIFIGPYFLELIPGDLVPRLNIISEFALGFIAYNIGSALNIIKIKSIQSGIVKIAIFESFGAVTLVTLSMIFIFNLSFQFSIVLGAIAAATAPAATIMVIRQYNAKGPLVDTLIPVVALDNAIGIILFTIMVSIAKTFTPSGASLHLSLGQEITRSFLNIGMAIAIGCLVGCILTYVVDHIRSLDELLCFIIAIISLSIGTAKTLDISSMLLCMVIGVTVSNLTVSSVKTLAVIEKFTPPVYVLFFVLASLKIDLHVFKQVGYIGIGYILCRIIGKIIGAKLGTKLVNASKEIQTYLGYTLIPQAGVALGLALLAEIKIPEFGGTIRTIIIGSTIVYELIGPVITKIALMKANQISSK
ncbi:transporter (CPA2 family) [Natranaerovirga pectinivora]|uniref:Transporter (CPA2 family) n=1 Tax=Natranaerovirga pectinivora TaxID=682400 RepID=A0A4R3MLU4_9FIRM|nr:cation:proton antiporter [Natranaerovirga pectinivora]TCT12869.1 transporter (CPA2 family) [Natranaerovirga pectinivora]